MDKVRKVLHSPSTAQPISLLEFSNALLSTWKRRKSHNGVRASTFGLAISGGVDSMALAALCSGLLRDKGRSVDSILPNLGFQAFVVDHGVRNGSNAEAYSVSKVLESRGIPTQVLKINWEEMHENPAKLPNFESLARKCRFQALGKACSQLGIDSLFLAHHEDDQAETAMMRMMKGHRLLGLSGMRRESGIPECRGLHAVSESGGLDPHSDLEVTVSFPIAKTIITRHQEHIPKPLLIERGGIKIYRPLLGFSKARLIATCQAENMQWFEDHTNQDPKITSRNAVRYMVRSHKLPNALSLESFVKLTQTAQSKMNWLDGIADGLLKECSIAKLDTRFSTLKIRFPSLDGLDVTAELWKKHIAALLLRQAIMFVTPNEHVDLNGLHYTVRYIFPELFEDGEMAARPDRFTVSGVQFSTAAHKIVDQEESLSGKCEWLISRNLFPSQKTKKLPTMYVPPFGDPSTKAKWSPWELYDGRFWLRIQNFSTSSVLVRPLSPKDQKSLRETFGEGSPKLTSLLRRSAPGKVRWTLPVIVLSQKEGKEKILALPTLGINMQDLDGRVAWEVRYKHVDTDKLPVAEVPS